MAETFEQTVARWWGDFKSSSAFPFLAWQDPSRTAPPAAMLVLLLGLATFSEWGAAQVSAVFCLCLLGGLAGANLANRTLNLGLPVPQIPVVADADMEAWGKRQARRVGRLIRYFDDAVRLVNLEATVDLAAKLWLVYAFGWLLSPSSLFSFTVALLLLPAAISYNETLIQETYQAHASSVVTAAGAEIQKLADKVHELRRQNEQTFNLVAGGVCMLLVYILLNVVGFSWSSVVTASALVMAFRHILPAGAIVSALVDAGTSITSTPAQGGGSGAGRRVD